MLQIHIKSLTIAQREEIIRRGLTDRSENVKKIVSKDLVPAWLRLCNDRLVEFLYALDVGNSDGETAKEVLNVIFQESAYKDLIENFGYLDPASKLMPKSKLSPETAVYWSNLAKFLHHEAEKNGVADAATYLENVLPELTSFAQYIREYIFDFIKQKKNKKKSTEEDQEDNDEAEEVAWFFVAKQLIEMTNVFDLADEVRPFFFKKNITTLNIYFFYFQAGRNNLSKLCRDLLSNPKVPSGFTDPVTRVLAYVQTNPNSRIQEVAEIIAELREPLLYPTQKPVNGTQDGNNEDLDDTVRRVDETMSDAEEPKETDNRVLSKAEIEKREIEQRKKQVAMAKVRVQLNILKNDLQDAIQNQDFVRAQEIKIEIDKLDDEQNKLQDELTEAAAMAPMPVSRKISKENVDAPKEPEPEPAADEAAVPEDVPFDELYVTHKALEILGVLLESNDIKSMNGTLQALLDEFIVPSVRSVDFNIRKAAVKAMGSCCIRSLDSAKRHLLLILQVSFLSME